MLIGGWGSRLMEQYWRLPYCEIVILVRDLFQMMAVPDAEEPPEWDMRKESFLEMCLCCT